MLPETSRSCYATAWARRLGAAILVVEALCSTAAQAQPASAAGPKTTVQGPGIIPIGSPLTYGGADAPDTYSAAVTFSPTPVLVDSGAVKIWQTQTPTGSSGEWDVFYMQTVNGGPLAGNISANWNIVIDYVLSAPVYFDGVVQQWLVNGTAVSPITNGIGSICCAATSNPILPGASYYNSGFSSPLPAGTQTNWTDVYVQPYSLVQNGGINPSTANGFAFAMHFTLQIPTVAGVISASAFGGFPAFAPGSWVEIYGTSLAAATQTWTSADFNGVNAPTALGGTRVTIGGQPAFVDYVSPLQVNVQAPGGVATGAQSLVVTTAIGSSPPFPVTVDATQPGLLAPGNFKLGGTQYVVAQFADGSYVLPPGAIPGLTSARAKPGDTIIIYGIGFGPVDPAIPPGQLAGQLNTLAAPLTVSIGGAPAAAINYDGLAPNYVGLYQFNLVTPNVPPNDATPLSFSLGATNGTQTLAIAIGN